MHPHRTRLICTLGLALLAGHAGAQEADKAPSVDESKLPDWVKRQAASPQKLIINSTVPRPKAEPAKPQPAPVRAARPADRKLPAQATEPTANRPGVPATATAPAAGLGSVATERPPTAPEPKPALVPTITSAPAPDLVLLDMEDPVLTQDVLDNQPADASVTVSFIVGVQGDVIDPQISASSDRRLNRSVLRAVLGWRYAPISEPHVHSVTFSFAPAP